MTSGRLLPPQMLSLLSHMCNITRAGIKPLDFTALDLFYLSFAGRLCFTEETSHLSAGSENKGRFHTSSWMDGLTYFVDLTAAILHGAVWSEIATFMSRASV